MNVQQSSNVRQLVDYQLERLKDEFHRMPEEDLFRMYLHYMVEHRIDRFNRIVTPAAGNFRGGR